MFSETWLVRQEQQQLPRVLAACDKGGLGCGRSSGCWWWWVMTVGWHDHKAPTRNINYRWVSSGGVGHRKYTILSLCFGLDLKVERVCAYVPRRCVRYAAVSGVIVFCCVSFIGGLL